MCVSIIRSVLEQIEALPVRAKLLNELIRKVEKADNSESAAAQLSSITDVRTNAFTASLSALTAAVVSLSALITAVGVVISILRQ